MPFRCKSKHVVFIPPCNVSTQSHGGNTTACDCEGKFALARNPPQRGCINRTAMTSTTTPSPRCHRGHLPSPSPPGINHPDTSSSSHDLPCNNCCFSASGGRPFPRDARSKNPRTSTSQLIQVQQLIARSAIDDRRRCSANHPDTSSSSRDLPCNNCCFSASCGRPSRRHASSKTARTSTSQLIKLQQLIARSAIDDCDGAGGEEDEGEASGDHKEGVVAALARRMARGGEEEEEGV